MSTHTIFQILFHCRLLYDIEYNSLCYTVSHCLLCSSVYLLYSSVYLLYSSVYLLFPNSYFTPLHSSPGFSGGSAGKESACSVGNLGLIPGLGSSPGEEKGYTLQYSGLENSMDCIIHGVAKSRTRLSNFHSHPSPLVTMFAFYVRFCLFCK